MGDCALLGLTRYGRCALNARKTLVSYLETLATVAMMLEAKVKRSVYAYWFSFLDGVEGVEPR